MVTIPHSSILTSQDATAGVQRLMLDFMRHNNILDIHEISEKYEVSEDWDLLITCVYHDEQLQITIPEEEWVPSAEV